MYRIDDLYRLYADNFFIFLTSAEQELFRNCTSFGQVEIRRGHQVAVIRDGGANACFLGDLVSEQNQLNEFGKKHAHTHWLEVKK